MATATQIAANRTNAQASTGPKTAEGKAKSSQNAVSLGLFTKQNCVQPEEREEYHNLYNALWRDLSPIGAMEELFATEIIRGAWRLRRCAMVEATLASYASQKNRAAHEEDNGKDVPYRGTCDPMIYDYTAGTQVAVDRARTQAAGAMRRATADLRRLQTERLFRAATLPENADASRFGLASFEEVVPKLHNEAKAQLLAVITEPAEGHAAISRVAEVTNRTESPAATAMPKTEVSHHRPAEVTEILKSAA
jgi:hypothetical protein